MVNVRPGWRISPSRDARKALHYFDRKASSLCGKYTLFGWDEGPTRSKHRRCKRCAKQRGSM